MVGEKDCCVVFTGTVSLLEDESCGDDGGDDDDDESDDDENEVLFWISDFMSLSSLIIAPNERMRSMRFISVSDVDCALVISV